MFNQLSNHFIIIRIFYSPSEKSGCSFFCPIRSDSEFSRLFSSATVNDFHFLALKNWREWRKTKIATCLTQEWGKMKTQNKLQVEDCPLNRKKIERWQQIYKAISQLIEIFAQIQFNLIGNETIFVVDKIGKWKWKQIKLLWHNVLVTTEKKVHNNRKRTQHGYDWVRIHIPKIEARRVRRRKKRKRENYTMNGEQHTKIQRRKRKIVNGRRRRSRDEARQC